MRYIGKEVNHASETEKIGSFLYTNTIREYTTKISMESKKTSDLEMHRRSQLQSPLTLLWFQALQQLSKIMALIGMMFTLPVK